MCTRIPATRRLVALYVEQLLLNPDYDLQISIADALTEGNIEVVQSLNLYPEYDRQPVYDAVIVIWNCFVRGSPRRWGGSNDHRRHRRGHLPRRLDRRVACCVPRTFTSEA
jgi:hypothetical protein